MIIMLKLSLRKLFWACIAIYTDDFRFIILYLFLSLLKIFY